jgi:hypothetical protein
MAEQQMGADLIRVECIGECGQTDRVPAKNERRADSDPNNPQYDKVPVMSYPYICLTCWLKGCRWDSQKRERYYVPITEVDPREV